MVFSIWQYGSPYLVNKYEICFGFDFISFLAFVLPLRCVWLADWVATRLVASFGRFVVVKGPARRAIPFTFTSRPNPFRYKHASVVGRMQTVQNRIVNNREPFWANARKVKTTNILLFAIVSRIFVTLTMGVFGGGTV